MSPRSSSCVFQGLSFYSPGQWQKLSSLWRSMDCQPKWSRAYGPFPEDEVRVAGPEVLVSLKGVPVRSPAVNPDGYLSIGALMRLADVVGSDVVRETSRCWFRLHLPWDPIRFATWGPWVAIFVGEPLRLLQPMYQFVEPCFKRNGNLCHLIPKGKRCWAVSAADTVPGTDVTECSGGHRGSGK